jgi:uncharacterized membrane protein YhhN
MLTLVALTVLALIGLLLAQRSEYRLGVWIAKPLASSGFVAVALAAGALEKIRDGDLYALALLAGLGLAWAGDLLLIPRGRPVVFRWGLFAFLLGHVAYGLAFASRGIDSARAGAAALILLIPALGVLRWLGPNLPGELRMPIRAYVVIISGMLALALATVAHGSDPLIALGAALFYASDLAVARDRFIAPGFVNAAWGLPLYYAGQLVLALTLA